MEVFRKSEDELAKRARKIRINKGVNTVFVCANHSRTITYCETSGKYRPPEKVNTQKYECFERFGTKD